MPNLTNDRPSLFQVSDQVLAITPEGKGRDQTRFPLLRHATNVCSVYDAPAIGNHVLFLQLLGKFEHHYIIERWPAAGTFRFFL